MAMGCLVAAAEVAEAAAVVAVVVPVPVVEALGGEVAAGAAVAEEVLLHLPAEESRSLGLAPLR